MALLTFLLICWGLTNIVSKGRIFESLRSALDGFPKLSFLIHCPMCLGFWVGLGVSIFICSPTQNYLNYTGQLYPVADGCIASGTIWVLYCLLEWCKCYDL